MKPFKIQNGTLRIAWVLAIVIVKLLLVLAFQGLFIAGLVWLHGFFPLVTSLLVVLIPFGNMVYLVAAQKNRCYTVAWMMLIFIFPFAGYVLHRMWGKSSVRGWKNTHLQPAKARGKTFLRQGATASQNLERSHQKIASYLQNKGFPMYEDTDVVYFPLGELQFADMAVELQKAKRFIFVEYFILNPGKLWSQLEEILFERAAAGVEVRLLIDDLGCLRTVPDSLVKYWQSRGLSVIRFNPIQRQVSRFSLNYRNHRKVCVIDGNLGYVSGTNMADEYANLYAKFGHWKDTAIRLEGEAVWSLTVAFLQMWEAESQVLSDYERYRPVGPFQHQEGFVLPFHDGPDNNPDNSAEVMYKKLIHHANDFVYITTPYLVIDQSMMNALATAAMSGVEVRILTPKIWDKRYVHLVTESNYGDLLKAGVKIYEYAPGYVHSKMILCDGDHAIIGSINMDYRSFHLNFENGVWLSGVPMLKEMRADLEATFSVSEEVKLEDWLQRPWWLRCVEAVLGLFAVLL